MANYKVTFTASELIEALVRADFIGESVGLLVEPSTPETSDEEECELDPGDAVLTLSWSEPFTGEDHVEEKKPAAKESKPKTSKPRGSKKRTRRASGTPPPDCSERDCDNPSKTRGLCGKHYQRLRRIETAA